MLIFTCWSIQSAAQSLLYLQVVFPFSLNNFGETNFIEQYAPLAQPIQTTYFILLAYCLISAMDRLVYISLNLNVKFRLCRTDKRIRMAYSGKKVNLSLIFLWLFISQH